jgi:choline dehydrogenase-like flavoprotein
MFKQMTMLTAIHSEVPHTGTFHKTWGVHDFYAPRGSSKAYGVVQSSGKLFPARSPNEPPDAATQAAFAARGMNLLLMTPSRAERENRIRIAPDGRIQVMFGPEQRGTAHAELVDAVKQTLVKVGYGEVFGVTRPYDNKVRWLWPGTHVAGSLRMGSNPADSVVDAACRVHGLDNLYVVDASVFPSQPAVNPALTIAANALRVADGIMGRHAPARP